MPFPPISELPATPSRNSSSGDFSVKMDAFLAAFPQFRTQANALAGYLDTLALATGPGLFLPGSVALPGIAFGSDPDTGLYRIGADQLGFAEGGVDRGRLYGRKNILGAVSQAAGVPTGAIIERGSNANGEFVKFADGTMICTKNITGLGPISTTAGSIFASATVTGGSFAAAFIDDPSVSLQPRATSSIWACRNSLGGPSFIGNFTLHSSSTNSSTTIIVTVTAIGRWF